MDARYMDGRDLKVGDTVAVWWANGRDTITAMRPYGETKMDIDMSEARIAEFAINQGGMTIMPDSTFEVIARAEGRT